MARYCDTDSGLKNPLTVVAATGIEIRVTLSISLEVANSDDRSCHGEPIAVCLLWINQSQLRRVLCSTQS